MSYDDSIRSISLDADASIGFYTGVPGLPGSAAPNTGKQYCFVKVTGAHTAGLAGAGESAVGVLQNKPQTVGSAATVAIRGISLVTAGGAVAAGDYVAADAEGRGVTGDAATANGIAIEAATAAGQLIPVLLK